MLLRILGIVAVVLLLSTLICGVWIGSNKENMSVEESRSSMNFHRSIGIVATLVASSTIIVMITKLPK